MLHVPVKKIFYLFPGTAIGMGAWGGEEIVAVGKVTARWMFEDEAGRKYTIKKRTCFTYQVSP